MMLSQLTLAIGYGRSFLSDLVRQGIEAGEQDFLVDALCLLTLFKDSVPVAGSSSIADFCAVMTGLGGAVGYVGSSASKLCSNRRSISSNLI